MSLLSGGVAFYAFLSIFPGIALALSLWGLFTDRTDLQPYFELMSGVLPPSAFALLSEQMTRIASAGDDGLTLGAAISLLIALWSSSRAINALMMATEATYAQARRRGFVQQNILATGFTAGGVLFTVISLIAIGAIPALLEALRLGDFLEALILFVRWLFVFGLFFAGTLAFYRFTAPKSVTRTTRFAPGALAATLIWLTASLGFSIYLAVFDAYNETFGSLGAVAALLMWLWISSLAITIGAEVNAEIREP